MLDKKSVKLLRYIKKNPNSNLETLKMRYGENVLDNLRYLDKEEYLFNKTNGRIHSLDGRSMPIKTNVYIITPKGIAYLEERHQNNTRYIVPLIISNIMSLAALVVSIINIIVK